MASKSHQSVDFHGDFEPHDAKRIHSPDNCPVKAEVEAIKNRAVGAWAVLTILGVIVLGCLGWAAPAFLAHGERIKVMETRQDQAVVEAAAERTRRDRERQEILDSLRRIEDYVRKP